jgi:hypothetical protein
MLMVHHLLTSKLMRKKEINEANDHGHISEKTGPFSG